MIRIASFILVTLTIFIAGCGGGQSDKDKQASVQAAVKAFSLAVADGHGSSACALLTAKAQGELATLSGESGLTSDQCAHVIEGFRGTLESLAFVKTEDVGIVGNQAVVKASDGGTNPQLIEQSGKWRIKNPGALLLSPTAP